MPPNHNLKHVADRATGLYDASTPQGHWVLGRTKEFCYLYSQGQWYFTTDRERERITFHFEQRQDADAFCQWTAASAALVTCT